MLQGFSEKPQNRKIIIVRNFKTYYNLTFADKMN